MLRLRLAAFAIAGTFAALSLTASAESPNELSGWLCAVSSRAHSILFYMQKGPKHPVQGTLAGGAIGIATDGAGNLYVLRKLDGAHEGVAIYPPGSTKPSTEFKTPGYPSSIAVARDGTMYLGAERHVILRYPPGSHEPRGRIQLNSSYDGFLDSLAVDSSGRNVYADLVIEQSHSYFNVVYRIPSDLSYSKGIFGTRFDGQQALAVDDQERVIITTSHGVAVFCSNPWKRCRFFALNESPVYLAYDGSHDLLYVASQAKQAILVYRYSPAILLNTITDGFGSGNSPGPLAIDPLKP